MKKTDSARCPYCTDSLGRPDEVVEKNGEKLTRYGCSDCGKEWYRTHN